MSDILALVGGTSNASGNVFARNPITGIYGPVCHTLWQLPSVSKVFILTDNLFCVF
jgi:hypothetical protein